MNSKDKRHGRGAGLRRRSEEIVRGEKAPLSENLQPLAPDEIRKAFHELQIYRIELEMQNEELHKAQQELEMSRARYFDLYDLAPVGYCTVSGKGLILEANLTAATLLGVARGALKRQRFSRFILKEDQDAYHLYHRQLFETFAPQEYEVRMVKEDGTTFWAHLSVGTSRLAKGEAMCRVVISDITDRKRVEEALKESENRYHSLSIVDDLTKLYNSRHFHYQLRMESDRADRYGQPLTLMMLDLDNFKQFNDTYGHVEGDEVLLRLGQVVGRCLRHTDSAYRYGGEEFTILLPMATGGDGVITAERIRTEFKAETFIPRPGREVHLTVSIGLAQWNPREDMRAFVHRADLLMYRAKEGGKDRVCVEIFSENGP